MRDSEGIFALGDCSTIEHDLMVKQAQELFAMADVDGDMSVTYDEFVNLMETAKSKYPQVMVQLSRAEKEVKKLVLLISYIPPRNTILHHTVHGFTIQD